MTWALQGFLTEIRAMTKEELIERAKWDMTDEPDEIIDALYYELRVRLTKDERAALYAEMVTG